jgi:hypothetical protein
MKKYVGYRKRVAEIKSDPRFHGTDEQAERIAYETTFGKVERDPNAMKRNTMHDDEVEAAYGFKGIIKKPTHFVVGERGREHMYIDPVTDYLNIEPYKRPIKRKSKSNLDYDFTGGFNSFTEGFKF